MADSTTVNEGSAVKRYVMAAAMGEAVAFPQGSGAAADAWIGSIAAEETGTEFVLASDYEALLSQRDGLREALRMAMERANKGYQMGNGERVRALVDCYEIAFEALETLKASPSPTGEAK